VPGPRTQVRTPPMSCAVAVNHADDTDPDVTWYPDDRAQSDVWSVPLVAEMTGSTVHPAPVRPGTCRSLSEARAVNSRALAAGAAADRDGPAVAFPAYPVARAARVAHGPSPDTSRTCTAIAVTGPVGATYTFPAAHAFRQYQMLAAVSPGGGDGPAGAPRGPPPLRPGLLPWASPPTATVVRIPGAGVRHEH